MKEPAYKNKISNTIFCSRPTLRGRKNKKRGPLKEPAYKKTYFHELYFLYYSAVVLTGIYGRILHKIKGEI